MPRRFLPKVLLVWVGLAWMLTACQRQQVPTPAPTPAQPTALPTATVAPSPTATPAPPTAVLWAPSAATPWLRDPAWAWVQALAQAHGWVAVQRAPGEALPPNVQVVVAVEAAPPALEARALAIAPPAEGASSAQALDPTPADLPHRAFVAGYLAAVITPDWRIAMLATDEEAQAAEAFVDGGRYFCGLCRPLYPPFVVYPAYALLPAESDATAWQAAVQRLRQSAVQTFVVSPQAAQAGVIQALGDQATLIALEAPSSAAVYAAAVVADVAAGLEALWEDPSLAHAAVPLRLEVYDARAVSPGRQRLVEEVLRDLEAGWIAP